MTRTLLNRAYYAAKPYLPWGLRLAVRRWFAVRKRRLVANSWPILEEAGNPPEGWRGWPQGKRFALILTHDVEGPRGVEGVRRLAELEMEKGFRSSFNFVPEGAYETPRSLREFLTENGFEVGVHDLNHDGWLYQSRATFQQKAGQINRYLKEWGAVGFRSGFMHHNYDWLHDLEVLYDASSFDTDPFEPQPDGVQTIFPFWIPAPAMGRSQNETTRQDIGRRSGYLELPYTLPQDSTLFLLFRESTIDTWKRKLEWIVRKGGMALLNVHPDYIAFHRQTSSLTSYPSRFYAEFLSHITKEYSGEFLHVLPKQLARGLLNTDGIDNPLAVENGQTPGTDWSRSRSSSDGNPG